MKKNWDFLKKKNRANQNSLLIEGVNKLEAKIEVEHHEDLLLQLRMIGLSREDLQIMMALKPLVEKNIVEVCSAFYSAVLQVPQLNQIISDNSTVERLQNTLRTHLVEMFTGKIDEEFIHKRKRVAQVHVRIGLEPKWYMGAFQNLQNSLFQLINQYYTNEDSIRAREVIAKILNFEQQLVLEEYEKENLRQRELQYEKVKAELKEHIAKTSEELAALTEQTSASVQQVASNAILVNQAVQNSAEIARDTQQQANSGQSILIELEERIRSIYTSTDQMEKVVKQLSESSNQIRNIITMVQQIADQTNLLALNAAIEAARAGEHGRGFAVVAKEVSNLAEQSKSSVSRITDLIQESTRLTAEVIASIGEVQENVELGQQGSNHSKAKFDEILEFMNKSIQQINSVESDMKGLVRVIEEIGDATQKVAASAENLNQTATSL